MIKTSRHEEEMAPGSWFMAPTPTRLESSAALTCHRDVGQGPTGWLCLSLGAAKWTALLPAVVLASGPLLHALKHKLLFSTSFVPGIMPGSWGYSDDRGRYSLGPPRICSLEEEVDVNQALVQVMSSL